MDVRIDLLFIKNKKSIYSHVVESMLSYDYKVRAAQETQFSNAYLLLNIGSVRELFYIIYQLILHTITKRRIISPVFCYTFIRHMIVPVTIVI